MTTSPSILAIRLGLRAAAHLRYHLRIRGLEHVPRTGAAVLVANHVTYADSLVLAGILSRPPRFLVYHALYEQPALNWFFRKVRAIPIASRREDPERLEVALREAVRALQDGELLGVFPEGQLTRTGDIGPFRAGVEQILAEAPAPVVPIALRGLWGSVLSHAGGPPFSRLPSPRRRTIDVTFGPPLRPEGLTASALERIVREMRGDGR